MRDENICKAIVKAEKEINDIDMSLTQAQQYFNGFPEDEKAIIVWELYTGGYLKI